MAVATHKIDIFSIDYQRRTEADPVFVGGGKRPLYLAGPGIQRIDLMLAEGVHKLLTDYGRRFNYLRGGCLPFQVSR